MLLLAIRASLLLALGAASESGRVTVRQVWADSLTNTLGAPSADGRYLSFVDVETGDLAIRDLTTGERRRLTGNLAGGQFAYFSTISPDSSQVAYAWFNDQKFYDLRVVGLDGSKPRVLYRNEEAGFVQPSAWSPDGKQILTLFFRKDNTSQIALVSAADGSVRILKSLNWVYPKKMDFSPDGRYIVYDNFARDGGPERDIFVLSADGSREVTLVQHPADDLFPVWSPDGKSILFASDRSGTMDAWRIAVVDGKPQGSPELVKRNLGRFLPMGITRSGSYYYGLRTGMEDVYIAVWDPATAKLESPAAPATKRFPGANSAPEWSADGKHLAYLSRRGPENYGQQSRVIVVQSPENGEERELSPKLAHIERLRWSRDGRFLLAGGSDRHGRGGLYRIDAQTAEVSPMVQDESASFRGLEGVWSADGKAIFYIRQGALLRRDLESGDEKELYRSTSLLGHPALSASGRRLAFTSNSAALLVMPAEGGEARELWLAPKQGIEGVCWTPDGKHVLASTAEKVWRIPAEGGQPQELDLPGNRQGGISLNPDGRRIAFTAGRTRSEVWVMEFR